ncbi:MULTISPECIES: hypothetical protein [Enterococcus]|uniref:hypothetical protein n=1 Tax=Enterococcus TaxID=1350 RepID=UPI00065E8181|nr:MULTISPECIES: hypothetical protein [Enterococcus]KAF1300179.1 hypothetical protein BAU16_13110 [Enterococcus sp. JM9B]
MSEKIVLEPFDRILSGYDKLAETAVSIADCSKLCEKYQKFGVSGYRLGNFRGSGYLNRYVNFSVDCAPLLIYKKRYLIPLVFRQSAETDRLFREEYRMEGFFLLLEWSLKHQPEKVIMDYNKTKKRTSYEAISDDKQVIDSAYLVFRLSEILDGAGFPISNFNTLEQFIEWNRIYRLIDNGAIGRHSKNFDSELAENRSELAMILNVVSLKYPHTTPFLKE